MCQVAAVDTGVSTASGTQCEPWIFPCDDGNRYYTKFAGHCDARGAPAHFRESELLASLLGAAIGASIPAAAAVFVPSVLASCVDFPRTGFPTGPIREQWAVGVKEARIVPCVAATFGPLVLRSDPMLRVATVAVHTWLGVQDHNAAGWNFFEDLDSGEVVSMDHATALTEFFAGAPPTPVALLDPGGLLAGVAPGTPPRTEVANRVRSVTGSDVATMLGCFPDDSSYPWADSRSRSTLIDWILLRQAEVASAIS